MRIVSGTELAGMAHGTIYSEEISELFVEEGLKRKCETLPNGEDWFYEKIGFDFDYTAGNEFVAGFDKMRSGDKVPYESFQQRDGMFDIESRSFVVFDEGDIAWMVRALTQ